MGRIRVLVVEPLLKPSIWNMLDLEDVFEKTVQGKYKVQRLDKKTVLVHNAEDKERELMPNRHVGRDIICGTFFIAADNGDGKLESLTDTQAEYYYQMYQEAEVISQQEVKENQLYFGEGIGKDEMYINNINMRLDEIDFEKVVESYTNPELTEAKELLKLLHQEFCDTFGTNSVDDLLGGDDVFIHIPVVMQSDKTGEICVGLVYVDTESSGEVYGAGFAFSNGFVSLDDKDKTNPMVQERMRFGSFEHWFTVDYYDDIHANKGRMPKEVKEMIEYARVQEQTPDMSHSRKNRHQKALKNGMNRRNSFDFSQTVAFIPRLLDNEPLPMRYFGERTKKPKGRFALAQAYHIGSSLSSDAQSINAE